MMRISAAVALAIFVLSAMVLLTAVPTLYIIASHTSRAAHTATADACGEAIDHVRGGNELSAALSILQQRYGLDALAIVPQERMTRPHGESLQYRVTPHGVLELRFHDEPLMQPLRAVRIAAASASAAAVAGIALLAMNAFSFIRSSDGGLSVARRESARHADSYLLETFETSMQTMKGRERELRRLHDQEKERADELATVSNTLVRSITSGFIAVDAEGLLVDVNAAARDLLDIPLRQVAGRTIAEVLGTGIFARTMSDAVENRSALQRQEVDDSTRIIGLTTVPLFDARDRYLGMLALFTDLTPFRRLEVRVREMQSLADLGEMSAGIAHEFRNSLSTIIGYLRLARHADSPAVAEERLRRAEDEAALLNNAVTSLLNFSKPLNVQLQRVDVTQLIREIVAQLEQSTAGIEISIEGELVVDGDPTLLRRLFENLLRNALDAIRAKDGRGTIAVRAAAEPPTVSISDNGIGVSGDDVQRLFLPFQSNRAEGFGLGLALAKKIALLHGGSIVLTGEANVGATATVEFRVPALAPA